MRDKLKTVGEVIDAYKNAFCSEPGIAEAAEIFYEAMCILRGFDVGKEKAVMCIAQEIDCLVCGYQESRK